MLIILTTTYTTSVSSYSKSIVNNHSFSLSDKFFIFNLEEKLFIICIYNLSMTHYLRNTYINDKA